MYEITFIWLDICEYVSKFPQALICIWVHIFVMRLIIALNQCWTKQDIDKAINNFCRMPIMQAIKLILAFVTRIWWYSCPSIGFSSSLMDNMLVALILIWFLLSLYVQHSVRDAQVENILKYFPIFCLYRKSFATETDILLLVLIKLNNALKLLNVIVQVIYRNR